MEQNEISRTDLLALERTKLANERTFLAYFRTFVVLLSSAFVILKMDVLKDLITLGYSMIIIAIIILVIGILRFFNVNRRISKYYK